MSSGPWKRETRLRHAVQKSGAANLPAVHGHPPDREAGRDHLKGTARATDEVERSKAPGVGGVAREDGIQQPVPSTDDLFTTCRVFYDADQAREFANARGIYELTIIDVYPDGRSFHVYPDTMVCECGGGMANRDRVHTDKAVQLFGR